MVEAHPLSTVTRMKKILSTFPGAGAVVVAATALLVGVVWATSSASDQVPDTTSVVDSTVPGDSPGPEDSVPDTTVAGGTGTEDVVARVAALEATVAALSAALDTATESVRSLTARVDATEATVGTFAAKTSQLSDDGTYTGSVTPSQISPRLTPDDLRGDWPLGRTSGSLASDRIEVSGWGCSPDSRYTTVLSVGAFRAIECARLPK